MKNIVLEKPQQQLINKTLFQKCRQQIIIVLFSSGLGFGSRLQQTSITFIGKTHYSNFFVGRKEEATAIQLYRGVEWERLNIASEAMNSWIP